MKAEGASPATLAPTKAVVIPTFPLVRIGGSFAKFTTDSLISYRTLVKILTKNSKGWLFRDKGYINKDLSKTLLDKSIELTTNIKKSMKKVFLDPARKYLLKKRFIIETRFDQNNQYCKDFNSLSVFTQGAFC
ncbi:MAG: transposase [Holosporales bacterium]|jgi:hypothetical protein|nr:transposase [Holosporales bacterium]